jgi:membrane associated rhomboid family serine protease
MSIWNEIKDSYRWGSALTKLIYINLAVFLILTLAPFVLWILSLSPDPRAQMTWLEWISVPSVPEMLATRPWTLLTYMFVHQNFFHILFNILYLHWFGRLFLEFLKPKQLVGVYILGGIGGAIAYLLAYNLIPAFYSHVPSGILLGASASVMAILFAVARYAPNHEIYLMFIGPARLKYIALAAVLIDLISIPTMENTGGHIAHLGGALVGYLFAVSLIGGYDISKPISSITHFTSNLFKKRSKLTVTHKRPLTDMEYNAIKVRRQKEVDRILEKIKVSGYNSLSKDEKQTLFEASQE